MSEYYGVIRSGSSLFHWGVKGMKWGVRKQIQRSGTGRPHSKAYSDAEKKLRRATMAGGIVGGLASYAKNKGRLNSSKPSVSVNNRPNINKTVVKVKTKTVNKGSNTAGLTRKQQALESEWRSAQAARQDALNKRNKSFLGSMGYGKKQKAYKQADAANSKAAEAFFNSMSAKQRKKYHNQHY